MRSRHRAHVNCSNGAQRQWVATRQRGPPKGTQLLSLSTAQIETSQDIKLTSLSLSTDSKTPAYLYSVLIWQINNKLNISFL